MEAMGLKDAAKALMDKAGVPITPGYHGKDQSPKLLKAKAGMIGYPVLIKAVAGGGGKGMRKVEAEGDFDAMLASCQREAKSSFDNDDVLIEKYIQSPRHIEVQVFGDTHGNVVHMFERDCSLQRRHQKVIEEAPAPGMTEHVRKAMTDAAIEAAKAVNYVGAGTVEFIVDGSGKLKKDGFWFMEMNTRLQVEHPVTEMITGLDLVELQIRVAQGEKLPKQKDIKMEGHAVEARLYAEDPANDFLPSVGRIENFDLGENDSHNRVDTGVTKGSNVSIHYDPMIAKAICHGDDREDALDSLGSLLYYETVEPLTTNREFLYALVTSKAFQEENFSTHFIADNIESLLPQDLSNTDEALAMAAAKLLLPEQFAAKPTHPFEVKDGWHINLPTDVSYQFLRNGDIVSVTLKEFHNKSVRAIIGERELYIQMDRLDDMGATHFAALSSYNEWSGYVYDDRVELQRRTHRFTIPRYIPTAEALSASSNALTAPMPGKIIAVNATVGDKVKAGDPLIIMEAMKMEMTLEALRDGIVAEVTAIPDALVTDGEMLLSLEEENE